MPGYDAYGKEVMRLATGDRYSAGRPSTRTDFGGQIDGTVSGLVAVEIETRTEKQVRGAILDLITHPYPKKLLVSIPKYHHPVSGPEQFRAVLARFIDLTDFRVVGLAGDGDFPEMIHDSGVVRDALSELLGSGG